jgi:hypothetical protein
MLTEEKFMTGLSALKLSGVSTTLEQEEFYYSLLRDDFLGGEFLEVCKEILKKEKLYGKLPEPELFFAYLLDLRRKESELKKAEEWKDYWKNLKPKEDIKKRCQKCGEMYKAFKSPFYRQLKGVKKDEDIPYILHEMFGDLDMSLILDTIKKLGYNKQISLKF